MITHDTQMNMDSGLPVIFDGKTNHLFFQCEGKKYDHEYPIGGMLTEYMRLVPSEIKEFITDLEGMNQKPTPDNMGSAIYSMTLTMLEKLPTVIAIMVSNEILNITADWFNMLRRGEPIDSFESPSPNEDDTVLDYIFKDSGFDGMGMNTRLQMLLSAYYQFSQVFVSIKALFQNIASEDEVPESHIEFFCGMYANYMDFQHIDYRIINLGGRLADLFTIKSTVSLFAFEMAHCLMNDVSFNKCPICGKYFVPEGRSDAIYCTYPSPKDPSKSCREVGAQITRANKEKNDAMTKEYRKLYMRLQMKVKRHPGERVARDKLVRLTKEAKEWRRRLSQGSATTEEYMDWLRGFEG